MLERPSADCRRRTGLRFGVGKENADVMNTASNGTQVMPSGSALGADTKEAFFQCLADAQRALFLAYSRVPPDVQQQIGATVDDRREKLFELLQSLVLEPSRPVSTVQVPDRDECWSPFLKFLARPEIQPIHFVRLMLLVGGIAKAAFGDDPYVLGRKFESLLNYFHEAHSCGLREIAVAFKTVGLDETLI